MLSLNAIINTYKLALKNSIDKDTNSLIEVAYRHYSHRYCTPLHVAEEIVPEAEALRIFFEDRFDTYDYYEMKDRYKEVYGQDKEEANSPRSPGALVPLSDEAWIAKMNLKAKEQAEARKKVKVEEEQKVQAIKAINDADKIIEEFNKKIKNLKAGALSTLKTPVKTSVRNPLPRK